MSLAVEKTGFVPLRINLDGGRLAEAVSELLPHYGVAPDFFLRAELSLQPGPKVGVYDCAISLHHPYVTTTDFKLSYHIHEGILYAPPRLNPHIYNNKAHLTLPRSVCELFEKACRLFEGREGFVFCSHYAAPIKVPECTRELASAAECLAAVSAESPEATLLKRKTIREFFAIACMLEQGVSVDKLYQLSEVSNGYRNDPNPAQFPDGINKNSTLLSYGNRRQIIVYDGYRPEVFRVGIYDQDIGRAGGGYFWMSDVRELIEKHRVEIERVMENAALIYDPEIRRANIQRKVRDTESQQLAQEFRSVLAELRPNTVEQEPERLLPSLGVPRCSHMHSAMPELSTAFWYESNVSVKQRGLDEYIRLGFMMETLADRFDKLLKTPQLISKAQLRTAAEYLLQSKNQIDRASRGPEGRFFESLDAIGAGFSALRNRFRTGASQAKRDLKFISNYFQHDWDAAEKTFLKAYLFTLLRAE